MTIKRKLDMTLDLIKKAQSEAAEAYNQQQPTVYVFNCGVNTLEACCMLDNLLEQVEKIYNQPDIHGLETLTNQNALTSRH